MIGGTVAFTFGAVSLFLGAVIAARLALTGHDATTEGQFRYLLIVPGVATLAYVTMALNIGTISIGSEVIILPRYVDWLLTTPVMIGYVGYVAGAPRRWIGAAGVGIAVVIALGAAATVTTGTVKWGLFGLSSLVQLGVFGVLYRVYPQYAADNPDRLELFWLLQNHVGVLWLAYPVIWLVGPAGLGVISQTASSMTIVYMDAVAKTPYVHFVWAHRNVFEGGTTSEMSDSGAAVSVGD